MFFNVFLYLIQIVHHLHLPNLIQFAIQLHGMHKCSLQCSFARFNLSPNEKKKNKISVLLKGQLKFPKGQ